MSFVLPYASMIENAVITLASLITGFGIIKKWIYPKFKNSFIKANKELMNEYKKSVEDKLSVEMEKLTMSIVELSKDVKETNDKLDLLYDTTFVNIEDRFFYVGEALVDKQEKISQQQFEKFEKLFKAYENIGGNGSGEALFEKVKKKYIEL